jgi:hypothetical protein
LAVRLEAGSLKIVNKHVRLHAQNFSSCLAANFKQILLPVRLARLKMENSSDNVNLFDPSTLKCRVGVKNFPANANQQELRNTITSHFEKYGKIAGKLTFLCRQLNKIDYVHIFLN